MLYGEDKVCANPIIDRQRHIASIDGACVLKDDGQLNCLIISGINSDDISFTSYDPFPVLTVLNDQAEGGRSYYIRWGDSRVQVLERGAEFSRCRHVRTGYEMDILTKYLFEPGEFTDCNDCTDYVLPLCAGDKVSVVEETSRGYFVKHNGVSGWYFGAFLDGGGGSHHAVLGAQNSCRSVYVYLLRISAGEDLEPCGAEQQAACKCCKFVHLSSSIISVFELKKISQD